MTFKLLTPQQHRALVNWPNDPVAERIYEAAGLPKFEPNAYKLVLAPLRKLGLVWFDGVNYQRSQKALDYLAITPKPGPIVEKPTPLEPSCLTCRHRKPDNRPEYSDHGYCRRYPPTVLVWTAEGYNGPQAEQHYPYVMKDNVCGEYSHRSSALPQIIFRLS